MTDLPPLMKPVAVFDAGIGSYAAVVAIQRAFPRQDVLYFADRASFPYGSKSRPELLSILRCTLHYLDSFDPAAVLVASNAPSITVLDELVGVIDPPIFGVRPPIASALAAANTKDIAVLGVQSMIESPELRAHADKEAGSEQRRIHLVNASPLVELVESGAFLFNPDATQQAVGTFMGELDHQYPNIGAVTLSSTHLHWLLSYLEKARPGRPFFDPLNDVIAAIEPHSTVGTGQLLGLVTESERFPVHEFKSMLDRLGVSMDIHVVDQ